MKVTSTALLSILTTLSLLSIPAITLAQQQQCLNGAFRLEIQLDQNGQCTPDILLAAYADQIYDATGGTPSDCTTSAADDLAAKLQAADMTLQDVCDSVYATQHKVPFTDAAKRGTDMEFEEMFFNGRTDWQEEVETLYTYNEEGDRTAILKEDAEAVRVFFEGTAQGKRVEWPGQLPNFQTSTGHTQCETNAAMCCWPKDRQANDNNGNCASPYDEKCVDKNPADNTDLCYVDLERGNQTTGIDSAKGLIVLPEDNDNGEGAVHCHGLAWSNDVNDHTARYKANNLFFVSMYDHMYQRGYVENIPGAPMCGCVEQMPTVSRSDCTQVDVTETMEIEYDGSSFSGKLTQVHVDFNACRGINHRNNDLWAYMGRLYYQNDITPKQWGQAGRIITDNGCKEATKFELNKKGYSPGHDHDVSTWTYVAGREGMFLHPEYGHRAFIQSMLEGANDDLENTHYGIIKRVCFWCKKTHKQIFYRRKTPVPDDLNLIDNTIYRADNAEGKNVWDVDFSLHSTLQDALDDDNPWLCPNNSYNYGDTFYGRCSPDGTAATNQRSLFHIWNDRQDVGYYVYKPEDVLFEKIDTHAIRGRDTAKGIALQDKTNDDIYMTGFGADIWGQTDDFNSLFQPVDGDHTVIVNVAKLSRDPYRWSKSGIMFRNSLEPNAAHFSVFLTGAYGVCPQARLETGAHSSGWTCVNTGATSAWLKIKKRMSTITSFVGSQEIADGPIMWTELKSLETTVFSGEYFVGLAVSSPYRSHEAVFTDYDVDAYYFPSAAPSVSTMPTILPSINLALKENGAVATQSSTCYGGVASRAIDGNTNGNWNGGSVQHTCVIEESAWWMVDLGSDKKKVNTIQSVALYPRTGFLDKTTNLDVQILDDDSNVIATRTIEPGDIQPVHKLDFGFPSGIDGRYVRVQKKASGDLNLAEVEVAGFTRGPDCAADATCVAVNGNPCEEATCGLDGICAFDTIPNCENGAQLDQWFDINGNAVGSVVDSDRYPDSPDATMILRESLDSPVNWKDNYGSRLQTWIMAPATCAWNFYIASDDSSVLHLSPDTNPEHKVEIANVPAWTGWKEWERYDSQNGTVNLVEGELYYLEAIQKEGGGGDHLSVAWECLEHGIVRDVISADSTMLTFSGTYPSKSPSKAPTSSPEMETINRHLV